ncbi:MAG: Ig-like domain-containing protein, partial [Pirellulales bacterium]
TLNNVLPSGASNTNVTITGQVTDSLSGVARLQVQVDGGAYTPVAFDPTTGKFAFIASLALDGSADGSHTVNFQATDKAGNVASPVPFTFTLATQAPTLTMTSPTDGGTLSAGDTLTGSVATSGGTAIVCLCYAFDGSTTMMPVPFNAGGPSNSNTFSQALDLSKLAAGSHTLLVEAQDAAGNTTTHTLHLTLAAAIPLTVTSLTPSDGSTDVGVTFRPEVTFSRPIDTTTLNSSNFYGTDTTGAAIAATIVPSADGTYAWLFFTNAMPGASTITLVVNGATIKAADGTLLDAAGNGTLGSELTSTFTTVSTAPVPGTTLTGIVADPGPDDVPGTRDDVRSGADGILGTADDVYLRPIKGVEVYILGLENQAVFTNAQGQFTLTNVPSGDVKLAVEGNVPAAMLYDSDQQQEVDPNSEGFYFPQMTLDLTIKPGVANTVMGSMGTEQEMQANATNLGVYLPRVPTSILQTISNTQPTTVGVSGASGLGLTPLQQQDLTLTVQPGSAIGLNGQPMTNVQVGISTVPPSIVMDMLPAGVMQHTFDITIQAPGVATFTTPAQLTFPNCFGSA